MASCTAGVFGTTRIASHRNCKRRELHGTATVDGYGPRLFATNAFFPTGSTKFWTVTVQGSFLHQPWHHVCLRCYITWMATGSRVWVGGGDAVFPAPNVL